MTPCKDCGGTHLVVSPESSIVCTYCGLIQEESFGQDDPRRFESADDAHHQQRRTSAATDPCLERAVRRERIRNSRSVQTKWISELRTMAERAQLAPHISDVAVSVYETAIARPDWKNRKHDNQRGVLVACLFHACNITRAHRTPAELCGFLDVDQRCARRMVKIVQSAADKIRRHHTDKSRGIFLPTEVVPRCAQRIDMSDPDYKAIVKECRKLFDATRDFIDNHRPDTICAGLISSASTRLSLNLDDAEIAKACLVSSNTVRLMSNKIDFMVGKD
nr:putative transcription initiation factor TFIIIB subunit Brf1/transcription initiation factor TFIIB [Oceanusvirus sp.]